MPDALPVNQLTVSQQTVSVSEMTRSVSSGTLNSSIPYHTMSKQWRNGKKNTGEKNILNSRC